MCWFLFSTGCKFSSFLHGMSRHKNNLSKPFLFMGNGLSSIILALITFALGLFSDASHPTDTQLRIFFCTVAGIVILCYFMFMVLINSKMAYSLLKARESTSSS